MPRHPRLHSLAEAVCAKLLTRVSGEAPGAALLGAIAGPLRIADGGYGRRAPETTLEALRVVVTGSS